jgi:hypothetical protein
MPAGFEQGRGLTLPRHAQVAASTAITSTPNYPKGGICVSTVSIVGGCRDLLDRVPADQIRATAAVADGTGGSW